jgi:mono/diheme cytochrome c family protein
MGTVRVVASRLARRLNQRAAGGDVMTRNMLWAGGALTSATLLAATLLASDGRPATSDQSTPNLAHVGSQLFRTYCASCHGTSALGDGPLASSMRRKPANLTEIARRNKGVYPGALVFRIIDGRTPVSGHGGPDMPVWGDAFSRSSETTDEASVTRRIQALVDFLETIQARDAQE